MTGEGRWQAGRAPPELVVVLGRDHAADETLGGKGRSLAALVAAGLPVPPTAVITTDAYNAVAKSPEIAAAMQDLDQFEAIQAAFGSAALPEALAEEIMSSVREVASGRPIAVRSSATVEDLHGSSFAGQYTSLLNIDSGDDQAVIAAVRQVWASLWRPAAVAYRSAFGVDESTVAMAVVLMQMVDAQSAGVVFTVDPAGAHGCARIETVAGLGESLVSGQATPEAWVVDREQPSSLPPIEREALALALAIEDQTGAPQDVEWAATAGRVYVVQARPITVTETDDGFDSPLDANELTTAGIVEMVPGVLPALRWETNRFLLEEAFRSVLDDLGILGGGDEDAPFIRRVRGRAALDFDRMRTAAARVPGAVERLEHEYFGGSGTQPPARPHNPLRALLTELPRQLRTLRTRHVVTAQADVVIGATRNMRPRLPPLHELDDDQLLRYRRRLIDHAARGLAAELGVAAMAAATFERLETMLQGYLGDVDGKRAAMDYVSGAGLDEARASASSAAVFAGPTWCELQSTPPSPSPANPHDRSARIREIEDRLQALPGWRRRRILTGQIVDVRIHLVRRIASEALEQLSRREATKAAVLELGGEVRRIELELGRRLTDRGSIEEAADVELLCQEELEAALDRRHQPTPDLLGRRRNWIGRYEAEGSLPVRFRGTPDRKPAPLPEGDVLEGWAASPGRFSGRARVVTSAKGRLERGEILVAEATDASWSPLFVRAGAIVVERGGPLSHAAILARELGLPAVLNIQGATAALDGASLTVDGGQGRVVVEQRPRP